MCYPGIPTSAFVLPLGDPDAPDGYTLVDPEDFDSLASYRWSLLHTNGNDDLRHAYAHGKEAGVCGDNAFTYAHRLITKAEEGDVCDHLNGDSTDNRRANIRRGTYTDNNNNRQYGRTQQEMARQRFEHAREATAEGCTPDLPVDVDAPCVLLDYREGIRDHLTAGAEADYERQMRLAWDRRSENCSVAHSGFVAVVRAEVMGEAEWAADYLHRSLQAYNRLTEAAERHAIAGNAALASALGAKARQHMEEVKRANDLLQHHLAAASAPSPCKTLPLFPALSPQPRARSAA